MFEYQKIDDPFLIYIINFSGKIDRNDIESYKKSLKEISVNKKFYYMIFDIKEVDKFKTSFMMELFTEIKKVKEEFKINMKGCSIITNKFCEAALNFIFLIVKPFCDSKIVKNIDEAIKFLCEINVLKNNEKSNNITNC